MNFRTRFAEPIIFCLLITGFFSALILVLDYTDRDRKQNVRPKETHQTSWVYGRLVQIKSIGGCDSGGFCGVSVELIRNGFVWKICEADRGSRFIMNNLSIAKLPYIDAKYCYIGDR